MDTIHIVMSWIATCIYISKIFHAPRIAVRRVCIRVGVITPTGHFIHLSHIIQQQMPIDANLLLIFVNERITDGSI